MIDAHMHVWQIGRHGCTWPGETLVPIYRDFTLDDWRAEPGSEAVAGVVLVQSQEDPADTAWLLDLAAHDPVVLGVVGWTDLHASDAPDTIARLAADRRLRGLRPMVQDRAADWFDDQQLNSAWQAMERTGLVLDALIRPAHLPGVARLAESRPDLSIVIDHAAKPDLSDLTDWHRAMRLFARFPQVRCKVSGLLTELPQGFGLEALDDVIAALLAVFGPDRLIWGGDWPVLTLAGSYRGWMEQVQASLPPAIYPAIYDQNARETYGLAS